MENGIHFQFFGRKCVPFFHSVEPFAVNRCGGDDFQFRQFIVILLQSERNDLLFFRRQPLDFDHGNALRDDAEFLGCGTREIDDSSANKRPSIVHADNDFASVGRIFHAQLCAERQRAMGASQTVVVEPLATGCFPSAKLMGIERGFAFLDGLRRNCR